MSSKIKFIDSTYDTCSVEIDMSECNYMPKKDYTLIHELTKNGNCLVINGTAQPDFKYIEMFGCKTLADVKANDAKDDYITALGECLNVDCSSFSDYFDSKFSTTKSYDKNNLKTICLINFPKQYIHEKLFGNYTMCDKDCCKAKPERQSENNGCKAKPERQSENDVYSSFIYLVVVFIMLVAIAAQTWTAFQTICLVICGIAVFSGLYMLFVRCVNRD